MGAAGKPAGIILTSLQWFENCLEKGCTVFHFPPERRPKVERLAGGSVCLILAKPAPGAPRGDWVFVGEFTVRSVRLVRGEEFHAYAGRVAESEVPFPRPGEASWLIEFENLAKYERPVKLAECCDVRTSTSREPLCRWKITGFTLVRAEDAPAFLEAVRSKARAERRPSHDELVEELVELGEALGFLAKREERTPDGAYVIDVTWREVEGHRPLKAFEVEMSGEVDLALARLAHAYDLWGCEQLWLVVSDEARAERARRLLGPRLRGSFARIRDRVRVLGWEELHGLYASLKPHSHLVRDLARR